ARSNRETSPAPARSRSGARSARRLGPQSFSRRPEELIMNLAKFFRSRPKKRRQPRRARLHVERLECRAVPSAYIDNRHTSTPEVEANIDLNPADPLNLVATAINSRLSDTAYFSRDGGSTWGASSPLPLSFQGTTRNASSDPTVAFDSRSNVYVA